MFLSDEIVKVVEERNPQTERDIIAVCDEVFLLCLTRTEEGIMKSNSDQQTLSLIKQMWNSFDNAAKQLKAKGNDFLKVGGLKKLILTLPEWQFLKEYNL